MASGYWVDWSDPPYPRIRPIKSASDHEKPKTLTECKQEIVEHARGHRQHWLAIIHRTKAMTAAKVEAED